MNSNYLLVERALQFATHRHKNQVYNGRPFIEHPRQVFLILDLVAHDDYNLLAAALLHDTLEDTATTYIELRKVFNADVADLVKEVTKTGYNTFPNLKTRRGVMLKMADRLANLSNIDTWERKEQQRYIKKSRFWKTK